MKLSEQPTGLDLVRSAVYASDAAKQKVVDQEAVVAQKRVDLASEEAVLAKLRGDHAQAERRLADLIAGGSCAHHQITPSASTPVPDANPKNVTAKPVVALDDQSVPIKWRIAAMLLVDPILDYQATAARLWGPLDNKTAKNRLSSQLQQLRQVGVIETLGSNRFKVDAVKLAELSGLPVGDAQTG
jgi:hypothetical protein